MTEGVGEAWLAHSLWAWAIGWMVERFTALGDRVERQCKVCGEDVESTWLRD